MIAIFCRHAMGSEYMKPDLLWVTIRADEAASARTWSATVGRLTSAAFPR
jgi:hypothetical protein